MRHAKSDHPPGVADRQRPLSGRGERSARAMGRTLAGFGAEPAVILTSPAVRAAVTASLLIESAGWPTPVEVVDDLYGAGVDEVLDCLARYEVGRVLAVGHEPTWSATVSALIGGGSIRMTTAAVACVEAPRGPQRRSGRLRWLLHPRLVDLPR